MDKKFKYPVVDVGGTGRNIRKLRKERGITVDEIVDSLNVTRAAVSRWECGRSLLNTENLYALSALFRVGIGEIIVTKR